MYSGHFTVAAMQNLGNNKRTWYGYVQKSCRSGCTIHRYFVLVLSASVYSLWLEMVIHSTWGIFMADCWIEKLWCRHQWMAWVMTWLQCEIKTYYKDQETEETLTGLVTSSAVIGLPKHDIQGKIEETGRWQRRLNLLAPELLFF
jgi:hypothetical protein